MPFSPYRKIGLATATGTCHAEVKIMARKEKLDPETEALIKWCIEVEGFLVAGGATLEQAQEHIEEQVEWFTDLFYEGLTPEEAAKAALNG
jgi:pyridoxine 5'-phosphate synthase PdxJ